MKTLLTTLAISLTSLVVSAQPAKRGDDSKRPAFSTEQQATLRAKQLTLQLDLTSAQESQINTLLVKSMESRTAQKSKKDAEENKTLTADQRYNMSLERINQQIAHNREMKSILSDEQYKLWRATARHNMTDGDRTFRKNNRRANYSRSKK